MRGIRSRAFLPWRLAPYIAESEYAKTQWPDLWKDRNDFESTKGHVTDHLGFSVDNLDETIARLKKDGVVVTDEPRTVLGKLKIAFIEGPDKVRIELVEGQAKKE